MRGETRVEEKHVMKRMKKVLATAAATTALFAGGVVAPSINASGPAQQVGLQVPAASAEAAGYTWGQTCGWSKKGIVNIRGTIMGRWGENRRAMYAGWVPGACFPTGYERVQVGYPTTPHYNWWGTRVR